MNNLSAAEQRWPDFSPDCGDMKDGFQDDQVDNPDLRASMVDSIESFFDTNNITFNLEKQDYTYSRLCTDCNQSPCYWVEHRDTISNLNGSLPKDLNSATKRKKLCRAMTFAAHGHLGKGHCVQLPSCCVAKIRRLQPDPDQKYMGHRDD